MTVNLSMAAATERAIAEVIAAGDVYYFGCTGPMHGHSMTKMGGLSAGEFMRNNPWGSKIDSGLCPGAGKPGRAKGGMDGTWQVEGEALWHHMLGWTAIAFWDRSVDSRGNSNSVFIARGAWSFEQMTAIAQRAFPEIWARFDFKVVHATAPPRAKV